MNTQKKTHPTTTIGNLEIYIIKRQEAALLFSSSMIWMEWDKVIDTLSREHTVYTIDLLGCGKSDKPAITYTCYLYVQLLTDFIRDIIGEKTDIVATGASVSFVTAACQNIADQIGHIILVCPESIRTLAKAPNHKSKLLASIINLPIYGTFIYNVISTPAC